MKYSCYQDSSVIYGWFVYWVSGWEMRRLSKSSEIRFQMASFSFSPCLMCWKVSSDSGLTWWLPETASQLLNLSNYCIWSLFFFLSWRFHEVEHSSRGYFMQVSKIWDRDVTQYQVWHKLTELKKAFSHFLTSNRKKMFRRILSCNFGCKEEALSDFLASRSSWKIVNTGKPALLKNIKTF